MGAISRYLQCVFEASPNETNEFKKLLKQTVILENIVLTGLMGVGKTVLLETFKPVAIKEGWLWAGTDLSESSSISEEALAIRLLSDLSLATNSIVVNKYPETKIGFSREIENKLITLNYQTLFSIYGNTPGLISDKIKNVLEVVWDCIKDKGPRGIVFAYDEAQNLSDHASKDQFPLSILLDIFQSIQRKNIPFMLVLTGLPTLFPKLVEARTFAERMFHVIFLDKLDKKPSRQAILKPIEENKSISLSDESVNAIIDMSGGYPYFIQFICREVYDAFIQKLSKGEQAIVPTTEIIQKLDTDFFYGRWARATDRQRELLEVIAKLNNSSSEFSVQEIVESSKKLIHKPFSSSHVNQMLSSLINSGLIYKNRHGKYSFAVPMLDKYILRQMKDVADA